MSNEAISKQLASMSDYTGILHFENGVIVREEKPRRFIHLKTGGRYDLLHDTARLEKDPTQVVTVYQAEDITIWVRDRAEFFDGRFKEITR